MTLKMMKKTLLNLPAPVNISYMWNFGSLLMMFLMIQILSGLLLSIHYCPNIQLAFSSIIHIMQNINLGWMMHNIHMNGASFFFIFMYLHISRGLYYSSYNMKETWLVGVTIFFISMATAFLGYVLPWGQMSFWGATVITNLISTIPYIGNNMVMWLWGGFSINNATLNRFYSFHFILPFIIMMLVMMHVLFLHETGSSNPLGLKNNLYKIPFHFYFTIKDLFMCYFIILLMLIIITQYPYNLSDPDNFLPANPLVTPVHIQPEWYFLFAYAILRSIPNKLGGVIALIMSIIMLYFLPFINNNKFSSYSFYFMNQIFYWLFINIFIMLTWLGSQPINPPFILMSQIFSILYFTYLININIINKLWEMLIMNINYKY